MDVFSHIRRPNYKIPQRFLFLVRLPEPTEFSYKTSEIFLRHISAITYTTKHSIFLIETVQKHFIETCFPIEILVAVLKNRVKNPNNAFTVGEQDKTRRL